MFLFSPLSFYVIEFDVHARFMAPNVTLAIKAARFSAYVKQVLLDTIYASSNCYITTSAQSQKIMIRFFSTRVQFIHYDGLSRLVKVVQVLWQVKIFSFDGPFVHRVAVCKIHDVSLFQCIRLIESTGIATI